MIIFFSKGRLGNQLFQYAFIRSIRKRAEPVLVSGFEELEEVFEVEAITNVSEKNRFIRGLIFRIISPFLNLLSSARLISSISVDYDDPQGFENVLPRREAASFTERKGVVRFIRYIKAGFFQSKEFFNKEFINDLKIKSEYLKEADNFLNNLPGNMNRIFVHIRRGDYKHFTIFGKSTLLPYSYYKNQIGYFLDNWKNCFFIILSDEPDEAEKEFSYIENKMISKNYHPGIDFAIITKCDSGILSTSTFGWWAAYFIKNKGIIFAPKYWMGFNAGIEFPVRGFPDFASEVVVKSDSTDIHES